MIQILALRERMHPKTKKLRAVEVYFGKKWRAASVPELFENIGHHLSLIPEDEHWNLFFTVASCLEERGRKLEVQKTIMFDLDGIDTDRTLEYIDPVCRALGVKYEETGFLFSGHGLHVYIELQQSLWIHDTEYFEANRHHYKACCGHINYALYEAKLPGSADPVVWSPGRMGRMPNTRNVKKDKPEAIAKLIQPKMVPVSWELVKASKIPEIEAGEHIPNNQLARYPKPDNEGVLTHCPFINRARTHGHLMSEPQWYALLSILARLDNGEALCHEYSKSHESYDPAETDMKIEQALVASGPRTCDNIATIWKGCLKCPHRGDIRSPILLKSSTYIKTKDTGFHEVVLDKEGNPKAGKPNYEDLRKYYESLHLYRTLSDSYMVFNYTGTHWAPIPDSHLLAFARDNFHPYGDSTKRNEFRNLVHCTNLVDAEWFSTPGKINFQNGILDLETMDLLAHDPDYGFRYVLPYEYDPNASCPRFDKFLDEVTLGDATVRAVIEEYMGYCVSYEDPSWGEKAMILVGEGSNGKSVLLDVMKGLAGENNYSSLTLADLHDPQNRYELDGKLFNLAEETPSKSLSDSSLFKNLVTGGETMVKVVYKPPFKLKNMAKLMFACNELPWTKDVSFGMFRRLLIVPFNARFTKAKKDRRLRDKLRAELPGIMNLVISGLKRLKRQNSFTVAEAMTEELDNYYSEADSVKPWFDNQVIVEDFREGDAECSQLSLKEAYRTYKFFSEQSGMRPEKYITFCRRLRSYFSSAKRFARPMIDGQKVSVILGAKLAESESY